MSSKSVINYSFGYVVAICLAAVGLIGLSVIIGWHTHLLTLVQIIPGAIPMQYNTALCFIMIAASAGGMVIGLPRLLPAIGAMLVSLTGILVIFQYAAGISLGIDTLFFYPWNQTLSADPGRMALTTAFSFAIAGASLSLLALNPRTLIVFVLAHTFPLSLGLTSLLGYVFGITYVLPFHLGSQMAIHTATAFTIYGSTMLFYAWQYIPRNQDGLPKWTPGIAIVMAPVFFISLSATLQNASLAGRIAQFLLAFIGTTFLILALHKLRQTRIVYKGLILISVPLLFVLGFVLLVNQQKHSNEAAQRKALHSKEVITHIHTLTENLVEAQSSIRGYVITLEKDHLEAYELAVVQISKEIEQLQILISDNPSQIERMDKLAAKADERLSVLEKVKNLVSADRQGEAIEEIRGGTGVRLMREFQNIKDVFLAEEKRLDSIRQEDLQGSWQQFDWLLVAGTSADLLMAFALAFLFTRGIGRRLQTLTENAQALASGDQLAPPLTGTDEIAKLDQVFHHMAQALQQAHDELESKVTERTAQLTEEMAGRRRTEQLRLESEERYRNIVETANEGIWLIDFNGLITYVNRQMAQMLGYTVDEMTGQSLFEFMFEEDFSRVKDKIERWKQGTSETDEVRLRHKDGSEIITLYNASPTKNQAGEVVGFLSMNIDITERKKAEQQILQSQKLESVGLLAGGIAHDFNNMLTAINGYSDLTLRQLKEDAPLRSYIEEIKKAGLRSADLTRQLLAFSRRQVLQPVVIDLNEIITDTTKMLKRLIGEDIALATSLNLQAGRVIVDPGQFSQIIMNLAVNARDAMPHGGKLTIETNNVFLDPVYCRLHVGMLPGEYVLLAVSDTGTGMSNETKQHIFEPFFTTKEIGHGTGLGLSTVYGIVKQSGGSIEVYSEEGIGTAFKIYLPRVEEAVEAEDLKNTTSNTLRGTETVLLVEDEEIVRNLSKEILETYGYQVITAVNGIEALSICNNYNHPIDLLVTDVVMPEMGGRELAEKLTARLPNLKILFTSGYTDDAVVRHGVIDTNTNFIQKPFTPESLAVKIRKILDNLS